MTGDHLLLLVPCPACGAGVGQPCAHVRARGAALADQADRDQRALERALEDGR